MSAGLPPVDVHILLLVCVPLASAVIEMKGRLFLGAAEAVKSVDQNAGGNNSPFRGHRDQQEDQSEE